MGWHYANPRRRIVAKRKTTRKDPGSPATGEKKTLAEKINDSIAVARGTGRYLVAVARVDGGQVHCDVHASNFPTQDIPIALGVVRDAAGKLA
jgi:hypothetical protein